MNTKQHNQSVFLFRRDLRLQDNTALIAAMNQSTSVMPVFVVDSFLVSKWKDASKRLTFLAHALKALDTQLQACGARLNILEGEPEQVLAALLEQNAIEKVYINRDYTPVARHRDQRLKRLCESKDVGFESYADLLLHEPEEVAKSDGNPYTVFTPYYKRAKEHYVAPPTEFDAGDFSVLETTTTLEASTLGKYLDDSFDHSQLDVDAALARIENLGAYDDSKNLPGIQGTSRLSALMRFGLCSARQVHRVASTNHGLDHGLVRQLYWRDFYYQIGFHFPRVFRSAFRQKYNAVLWDNNPEALKAWQEGKTGFPIVDAGMRELKATGYMHNRVRMLTAAFLTKNLHMDWRLGEKHFAKHLIDFDPSLNNGNWQWSASTGCDAQPYFRVFNPWRQQSRFDADCTYIKKWIPELRELSPKEIHGLEKQPHRYLPQILDLKSTAEESKQRFRAVTPTPQKSLDL